MASETLQNTTEEKSLLPAWYYDAFAMKIMGLTSEQIADRLMKHPVTVRSLFSKKGALYKFWRAYVEEHRTIAEEEILDMMWGHLPDIIRTRIVKAKTMGLGSNEAAKIILGFTMGDPSKPTVQNNIQINNTKITGFNYIVPEKPNDPDNTTNLETTPSVPGVEGSDN